MIDLLPAGLTARLDVNDPSDTACCVFVEHTLLKAYNLPALTTAQRALARIFPDLSNGRVSGQRAWGPVVVARELGVVESATFPWAPPKWAVDRWHLVQGWRIVDADGGVTPADGDTGHTFFVRILAPGWCVTLDSNERRGVVLQGYRSLSEVLAPFTRGGRVGVAVAVLR